MVAVPLSSAERKTLAQDDPEVLDEFEAQDDAADDIRYPKPEMADIDGAYTSLVSTWSDYHAKVNENRDLRYQRDETPPKWRRHLEDGRRVRTRLGHNEVLRVVGNNTRNSPKCHIPPAGAGSQAEKKSEKQTRWANAFLSAMERRAKLPLWRMCLDSQAADGQGIMEVYLTSAYDDLDFEYQQVYQDGGATREENDHEYLRRTEQQLIQAGSPIGVRVVDVLAVQYDRDEDGLTRCIVAEMKPYRQVYAKLVERLGHEALRMHQLPKPGSMDGWPIHQDAAGDSSANGEVLVKRYYDRRWYGYEVGGELLEVEEHGLPGCPIFPFDGIITSSPNIAERLQGITWGMDSLELALNDRLTQKVDNGYIYGRPKGVIITPIGGKLIMGANKSPINLDLSNPRSVPQLNPGQTIVDAYAGFNVPKDEWLDQMMLQLWQRSGLNPVAQGSSPGADPAGFTVNSLQGAALANYEVLLDNAARAWGDIVDFVRRAIRDTVKERVYLTASRTGGEGVEWLSLGPDDVDDVPCQVSIDPLSDTQRMIIRQSLTEGWTSGVVPRQVLQTEGYGCEDPAQWDNMIVQEKALERIMAMLIDNALWRVQVGSPAYRLRQQAAADQAAADQAATAGGAGDGSLPPKPSGGGVAPSPEGPAPPRPSSVGVEASQASQGAGMLGTAGPSGGAPRSAMMAGTPTRQPRREMAMV